MSFFICGLCFWLLLSELRDIFPEKLQGSLYLPLSYSPCFSFPSVFTLDLFPLFTISPRDGYQQAGPGKSLKTSLAEPLKMHLHPRIPGKIPKISPELSTLTVNKTVDWGFFWVFRKIALAFKAICGSPPRNSRPPAAETPDKTKADKVPEKVLQSFLRSPGRMQKETVRKRESENRKISRQTNKQRKSQCRNWELLSRSCCAYRANVATR